MFVVGTRRLTAKGNDDEDYYYYYYYYYYTHTQTCHNHHEYSTVSTIRQVKNL
jgi:hypothetical protein